MRRGSRDQRRPGRARVHVPRARRQSGSRTPQRLADGRVSDGPAHRDVDEAARFLAAPVAGVAAAAGVAARRDRDGTVGRCVIMGFRHAPGCRSGAAAHVAVSLHAIWRRWRGGVRARPRPGTIGRRQLATPPSRRQHGRRSRRDVAAQPAGRADAAVDAGGKSAPLAHPRRG